MFYRKKDLYWTDLQLTQEYLYQSEERFRQLAENAPDIIYELQLSPEMKCNYVSPAVINITGHTPEDFYHDPNFIRKITHPGDIAQYNKLISGGIDPAESITMRWFHKEKQALWMEIKGVLIFDSNQKSVALEGMARNITAGLRWKRI